ncbi:MAG TPA: C39 family peptidase [archaeon]|nr:C39 family peptidase [archaeon]
MIKTHQKEYKRALSIGLKHKKNATISLIKKFIDNNTPVLTEVSADKLYKENLGYTHMIVVVGYDKNNFYFHDPDKIHGGKNKKILFSKFRKAWEKISSNSGRSMTVIEKR